MSWMIKVLGFDSWQRLVIFLFTTMSRMTLGLTQPPIQWVPEALSLWVKWTECEADHSPPSSAKRMHGAIPPLPQYVFMAWCLVKHRDNFTFTFFYYQSVNYDFVVHFGGDT
jgi:hypothetical protein